MPESWRSQRPREMLFDGTIGRAHKQFSSLRLLRYTLSLIFAGGSFVLSFLLLIAGALLARPQAASQGGAAAARQVTPGGSVVFATQVRPILASRCYPCNGPDIQQHGLRMDSLQGLLMGGMNGKVVIPGNSQESHIVRRLLGLEQPQMPYGGPPLPPEQIDLIRKWIDEGAPGPDSTEPIVTAALTANDLPAARNGAEKPVDFNRDIRPILSDACFTCHGPEEKSRQGGLRLDTKESAFAERNGYGIIVPGSSATSRLYQKISSKDDAFRMPPPWSGRSLTAKQIELFRRWIDQGAKWQSHWAFEPPKRPTVPQVKDQTWPENAIDKFTL